MRKPKRKQRKPTQTQPATGKVIYSGVPGHPPRVHRLDASGLHDLRPEIAKEGFAWGDGGLASTRLALALLVDALGDEGQARRFYQRFKHRTVATWRVDSAWSISAAEIILHIEDMQKVERETAQLRSIVDREPAPVVAEGGGGVKWTSAKETADG